MDNSDRERLKSALGLTDLDAPPKGEALFFVEVRPEADDIEDWVMLSSQEIAFEGAEQRNISTWAQVATPDSPDIHVDISILSSRAKAREALLNRAASAQSPDFHRVPNPSFAEIVYRNGAERALVYQSGNMVGTILCVSHASCDLMAFGQDLFDALSCSVAGDATESMSLAAPGGFEATIRVERRPLKAGVATRLDLGEGEAEALAATVLPTDALAGPTEATPPWPTPKTVQRDRMVLSTEQAEVRLDGNDLLVTAPTSGSARVTLRKRAQDGPVSTQEWLFDVEDDT